MTAITRLGLYGGSRKVYAAFPPVVDILFITPDFAGIYRIAAEPLTLDICYESTTLDILADDSKLDIKGYKSK